MDDTTHGPVHAPIAYKALYVGTVVGLFLAWSRDTPQPLRAMIARRWPLALGLGAIFPVISALIAPQTESGSRHPDAIEFIAELTWRGVVYGAADGPLLSAFRIVLVFRCAARDRGLWRRAVGVIAVGALAMVASLAMTAAYHAGYGDFRSSKLRKPMTGEMV